MSDTFPAGWLGGWGQVDIKDHLSPAKLELGLSLAINKYSFIEEITPLQFKGEMSNVSRLKLLVLSCINIIFLNIRG